MTSQLAPAPMNPYGEDSARVVLIPLRNKAGEVVAHTTIDAGDAEWAEQYRWHRNARGYAARGVRQPDGSTRIFLMARELLGLALGDDRCADHINRDRLDNRRQNLRIVTKAENGQNRSLNSNNRSGVRGVSWSTKYQKWTAYGRANGRCKFLGYFDEIPEAARAVSDWRAVNLPLSND